MTAMMTPIAATTAQATTIAVSNMHRQKIKPTQTWTLRLITLQPHYTNYSPICQHKTPERCLTTKIGASIPKHKSN